jgi:hypothetical protein
MSEGAYPGDGSKTSPRETFHRGLSHASNSEMRPGAAAALTLLAGCAMTLMVVVLAGGPIRTPDFWFHLEAGEAYVREGPWPATDPMLHTAHCTACGSCTRSRCSQSRPRHS